MFCNHVTKASLLAGVLFALAHVLGAALVQSAWSRKTGWFSVIYHVKVDPPLPSPPPPQPSHPHLISSHLISSHLIPSQLISFKVIWIHLESPHLVSSHLIIIHQYHLISVFILSNLIPCHLNPNHLGPIPFIWSHFAPSILNLSNLKLGYGASRDPWRNATFFSRLWRLFVVFAVFWKYVSQKVTSKLDTLAWRETFLQLSQNRPNLTTSIVSKHEAFHHVHQAPTHAITFAMTNGYRFHTKTIRNHSRTCKHQWLWQTKVFATWKTRNHSTSAEKDIEHFCSEPNTPPFQERSYNVVSSR